MKKEEQVKINQAVMEAVKEFNASDRRIINDTRFRRCTARVLETPEYYILRSYNTNVAFINKSTGILFDVLRYVYGNSSSSAQHISKFDHDYEPNVKMTYYPV